MANMVPVDLQFQVFSKLLQMLKPYLSGAEQQACSLFMKNLFTPSPLEVRFDHSVEILQTLSVSAKEGQYDSPGQKQKRVFPNLIGVKKESMKLGRLAYLTTASEANASSSNSLQMHVKKEETPASLPHMCCASDSMPEHLTQEIKAIVKEIPMALEWVKQLSSHEHVPLVLITFLKTLAQLPKELEQESSVVHCISSISHPKTSRRFSSFYQAFSPLIREKQVSKLQPEVSSPDMLQKLNTKSSGMVPASENTPRSLNAVFACSSRVEAAVAFEDASPLHKGEPSKIPTFSAPPFALPFFHTVLTSLIKTLKGKKQRERKRHSHEEEVCDNPEKNN
jgi:hypothetical protein